MERKSYSFKAALEGNTLAGGPAVIGNMDLGNDVIFPGAFKGVLSDFLKNGFICYGHEWDELPIGYPTVAREQDRVLYSEAEFHSTQAAQDAKTIAAERLRANKNVGLSIGFQCAQGGTHFFENGEMLLVWAKEKGYNLALFDESSILACKDWCRGITQFSALYEWSIALTPMNPEAQASGIKGVWTPEEAKARVWTPGAPGGAVPSGALPVVGEPSPETILPADPEPAADWRAKLDAVATVRDAEEFLRDAGLSRKQAAALLSHLKPLLRDAVSETPAPPAEAPPAADPAPPVETETKADTATPPPDPTPDADPDANASATPADPSAPVTPRAMPSLIEQKRQELAHAAYQRFLALQAGVHTPVRS